MQRDQYITAKHVKDRYDISTTALRRWADDEKKIRVLRVGEVAGRRLYHSGDIAKLLGDLPPVDARVVLLYARVSSAKQSGDLERQCTDLRERYPGAELIRDTASGLNFRTHQHRHCPRTCRYPQRQTCSLWSGARGVDMPPA